MPTRHNPADVAPPTSNFSHGVEVAAGQRLLFISGQVGAAPDGKVLEGIEAQTEQVWKNVFAVLKAAGMSKDNLLKITTFVLREEDLAPSRAIRQRVIGDPGPASTLVLVKALANPAYLIEIEAIAAG